MVKADENPSEVLTAEVFRAPGGRVVRPSRAARSATSTPSGRTSITFGIGPAGTGKSWLAVACAVQALNDKQVDRIILTRPAVEAGERLGFLPGDLMAKVDPYLRPLYDALHDMVGLERRQKLLERGAVEVAPLAFMRGRAQPVRSQGAHAVRLAGASASSRSAISSSAPTDGRRRCSASSRRGGVTCSRVRAQDGAETRVCGEHLWFVKTPADRSDGASRGGSCRPRR